MVMSVLETASLTYLFTVSLPLMPICPGIQINIICFWSVLASSSLFRMRIAISFGLVLFFYAFYVIYRITDDNEFSVIHIDDYY